MSFTTDEIKKAYIRLKSYIYYDTTDLLLRKQLVEFETDTTKDFHGLFAGSPSPYQKKDNVFFSTVHKSVEEKLDFFCENLNNHHDKPDFFNHFISEIKVNLYPKKFIDTDENCEFFITNKRVKDNYQLERVTSFIEAPIELHIISVLWIIKYGVNLDNELTTNCLGNRLLIAKEKKQLVHGSGLFKPYYNQYKKWRDESVSTAQRLLEKDENALFLNLDIKDYFHSIRIDNTSIHKKSHRHKRLLGFNNLKEIFLKIHHTYTESTIKNEDKLTSQLGKLRRDNENNLLEFILPIGFLSSYVLANHYLKDFDTKILEELKPAYYGRYVDDILLVIADPNPFLSEKIQEKFRFAKKESRKKSGEVNSKISFNYKDLNQLEEYVIVVAE